MPEKWLSMSACAPPPICMDAIHVPFANEGSASNAAPMPGRHPVTSTSTAIRTGHVTLRSINAIACFRMWNPFLRSLTASHRGRLDADAFEPCDGHTRHQPKRSTVHQMLYPNVPAATSRGLEDRWI